MYENILQSVKNAALAMQRFAWEQGVLAQAMLDSGDIETAMLMAVEAANRSRADGRLGMVGSDSNVTDPLSIGEVLLMTCEETNDPFLRSAADKLLDWALTGAPRNPKGIVYHIMGTKQFWVDSFNMLPPFLACAGYYNEAMRQLHGYWNALYNTENGFLSHMWDDGKQEFARKAAWASGNGWALAGMARVIDLLPVSHMDDRKILIGRVKSILDRAIPLQTEDGMFHDVLDDETTFPELTFGMMAAFAIYKGISSGWLDSEKYRPMADRVFEAAVANVDGYGLVRNVCGQPNFCRPGTSCEAQAYFIEMFAARARLDK